MTHVIYKSRVPHIADVDAAVKAHAHELEQWTENMRLYDEEQRTPAPEEPQRGDYEDDKAYTKAYQDWGVAVSMRRARYPGPEAHPDIVAAVEAGSHRVVDDTPEPVSQLQQLKNAYLGQLHTAEVAAQRAIHPVGKLRLAAIRHADILAKDAENVKPDHRRFRELTSEISPIQGKMNTDQPVTPEEEARYKELAPQLEALGGKLSDREAHAASLRPAEDTEFLKEHTERQAKFEALGRRVAQAASDIEDLTEDDAPDWVLPNLE